MAENEAYVPDFDISKPTIARVYDATLGGKDNFAVDREGAAMIAKHVPKIREASQDNRLGLTKGVRYVARQGIDQFLDIGAGLPTMENTHQVAQAVNPNAKVCYVDNDRSCCRTGGPCWRTTTSPRRSSPPTCATRPAFWVTPTSTR